MVDDKDNPLQELQNVYCPPLDTALFSAIASDFDLADPASLEQLKDTLDALRATAEEQQDLPFDPSGTGGLASTEAVFNDGNTSRNDTNGSRETDITSLPSDLSSVFIGSDDSKKPGTGGYILNSEGSLSLTGLTAEEKTSYLSEMFPTVTQYTIKHTLTKCDYDVDRSMDVLLNLSFFDSQSSAADDESTVFIPKGVDGFASPSTNGKRKGKNKKAKSRNSPDFSTNYEDFTPQTNSMTNKWDVAKDDLEFIHSRTSSVVKKETVASAYHKSHASCSKTIKFLATSHAPKDASEDAVVASQIAELAQDFPALPPTILEGLLNITGHSVSAANELARAMVFQPLPQLSDIIQINAPAPILDENEAPKRGPAAARGMTSNYTTAQSMADAHFAAGSTAFTKASTAYRRSKSDRYMGGAAAYYASVGRNHLEKAKRESSAAADALVNSQSTSDVLDLHGVSVHDGVRIANNRVCQWWDALGDTKYAAGGTLGRSYKIITGAGRHSRDGTSRLGPAVGKMLVRDGWKVEVSEGVLTVTGKRRSK